MNLSPTEERALAEFVTWARQRFGDRVVSLCLFGSRARGEGNEASDLDVQVVVAGLTAAEAREIAHRCGDILTEHDVLVSPFAVSQEHMERLRARERRIVSEIDKDGIAL